MKSVSSALATHLAGEVTTLASCWHVTRRDGQSFYVTDHDQSLVIDGNAYLPTAGWTRTAVAGDSALTVDNTDIEGIVDGALITDADLRAGQFDYASVEMFAVNWADLLQGKLKVRKGWLGEVGLTRRSTFQVEVRGLFQALQQRIVELYSPECRADLGDGRCKVPLWPAEVQRSTAYAVGDTVRVYASWGSSPLGIADPSFEASGAGWTVVLGSVRYLTGSPTPHHGTKHVSGGAEATSEIRQDVALVPPCTTAKIDAGAYTLDVSGWRAQQASDDADTGQVIVHFLDGGGDVLSTPLDTGAVAYADDVWHQVSFANVAVPANARAVRLRFLMNKLSGSYASANLDDLSGTLKDSTAGTLGQQAAGVIFECTTAGTTAAAQPTYNTTPGSTTTDGTAVFTCRAGYFKDAAVTSVTDRRIFVSDLTGWADDYATAGFLVWETGANAGISSEVKAQTGSTIEVYLPQPYTIAVGDRFRVFAGCDKRLATCKTKFDNVVNFRGEPHVPGKDAITLYPDAK